MKPMRYILVTTICLLGLVTSGRAEAQSAVVTRPPVQWIGLGRPGDTTGSDGHGDKIGELSLEPLRVGLLGEFVPLPTNAPGCSPTGSFTGSPLMPSQHLLAMN